MSKVFGEALGSLYADKYGMEVFCMRIGNVNPVPIDKRRLSILFTPRDLAQLVTIGIEHPDIRFEIVYGISKNKRAWYDNSNAYRLGYKPQDDSEICAAEVLAREQPGGDPIAELHQGGVFCVAEDDSESRAAAEARGEERTRCPRKRGSAFQDVGSGGLGRASGRRRFASAGGAPGSPQRSASQAHQSSHQLPWRCSAVASQASAVWPRCAGPIW